MVLVYNWAHSSSPNYETAKGRVLGVRKVVDSTRDSIYGGRIYYRIETHVQYELNGKTQDRWLRASDDMPRETLALKLAHNPTECLVYWIPDHPENAKCSLR